MHEILSEQALDESMRLFWLRGYFNTPIDALVRASGLNRAIIYQRYGGKEGFFIAMLERYWTRRSQQAFAILRQDEPGLGAIRQFLNGFIDKSEKGVLSHGCFYIATASELPSHQARVKVLIHQFIEQLGALFQQAMSRARERGEITEDVDIEACADFLLANVFGLLSLARAEHRRERVRHQISMLEVFLSTLLHNNSQDK